MDNKKHNDMKKCTVIKLNDEIVFDNGMKLYSYHDQDCCESHYLSFDDLTLLDFDGLEFNLSNNDFFRRIEDYGIELIPIHGHSVKIPGYASNNGYYSSNLKLILEDNEGSIIRRYDITECQKWDDIN